MDKEEQKQLEREIEANKSRDDILDDFEDFLGGLNPESKNLDKTIMDAKLGIIMHAILDIREILMKK